MSVTTERHLCSFCSRIAAGAGRGDLSVAFDDFPLGQLNVSRQK